MLRSGWNFAWRSMGIRRIEENYWRDACVRRARFIREKHVFWGGRKTRFSGITFFLVDMEESGQSNVCRASDARNFGTKFVGIEALWPRFCPDRKLTRSGPIKSGANPQHFWPGGLSWFWCHSTGKCRAECPSHMYERSRASLTRYGPPNSKMVIFGCFWIFRQLRSIQI